MLDHRDRAGILTFDLKTALKEGPAWTRQWVLALEWPTYPLPTC